MHCKTCYSSSTGMFNRCRSLLISAWALIRLDDNIVSRSFSFRISVLHVCIIITLANYYTQSSQKRAHDILLQQRRLLNFQVYDFMHEVI